MKMTRTKIISLLITGRDWWSRGTEWAFSVGTSHYESVITIDLLMLLAVIQMIMHQRIMHRTSWSVVAAHFRTVVDQRDWFLMVTEGIGSSRWVSERCWRSEGRWGWGGQKTISMGISGGRECQLFLKFFDLFNQRIETFFASDMKRTFSLSVAQVYGSFVPFEEDDGWSPMAPGQGPHEGCAFVLITAESIHFNLQDDRRILYPPFYQMFYKFWVA